MTFGSMEYRIASEDHTRLLNRISKEKLLYSNMKCTGEQLQLCVSLEHCIKFERICRAEGITPERIDIHGMLKFYRCLFNRPGLIVGVVLSALLMIYYSNVILTISIDTDSDEIRGKVMDVLYDEGARPGAYLPDTDLVLVERALKRQIDEISWAGISRTGSGIAVDIIETVTADKGITKGMPCDLIACENGVIEEIELIDGQLVKCLGSGVTKGETVVSGKIMTENTEWTSEGEVTSTQTRYVRSIGKIRGSFERTVVFEQKFDTEIKALTGKKDKLRYLEIFSADIPLFFSVPEGWYETEYEKKHYPEIGGLMLPMGWTEISLEEFDYRSQILTEDEAFAMAEKASYRYEQNFLKNYEIRGRDCKKETDKNGVRLTVTYELYGDICKESDFFIPRYIVPDKEKIHEKNVQDSENN